ncbi:hypothetical protein M5D96_003090, partial [Drosophila gunungcola]
STYSQGFIFRPTRTHIIGPWAPLERKILRLGMDENFCGMRM